MTTPNYADQRGHALRNAPDILIMERTGYGWRFRIGWHPEILVTDEVWFDPNNIALDFEDDSW